MDKLKNIVDVKIASLKSKNEIDKDGRVTIRNMELIINDGELVITDEKDINEIMKLCGAPSLDEYKELLKIDFENGVFDRELKGSINI